MSKIVCDVCGTSYPETATQCPICGCIRPSDVTMVMPETNETESNRNGAYTYVKGGRFSKANVKKRNQGVPVTNTEAPSVSRRNENKASKNNNDKGFVIAVVLLLAAIVAVVVYIAMRFFVLNTPLDTTVNTTAPTVEQTQDTTEAADNDVLCKEIFLGNSKIEFSTMGESKFLQMTLHPANTTEVPQFESSDPSVAKVDPNGRITAIGDGEATITVTCGTVQKTCTVSCVFETETTAPEETEPEETTAPTISAEDFELNRKEFTLSEKGQTWLLYRGEIPVDQITWTSDDEKVVTIEKGVVTAVGKGYTYVHGEYKGVKNSCKVICSESVGAYVPTEPTEPAESQYKLNKDDVTLRVIGEQFTLKLLDADNSVIDVIWSVDNPAICSVSGNTVEALAAGTTYVSTVYDGQCYTCIVRVVI